MDTDLPIYLYRSKLATELASIFGIQADLKRVKLAINACFLPGNELIREALYHAAIISYRRCFNNSARTPLPHSIAREATGGEEYHNFLLGLADKLVAHSVNAFEQVKTGVIVEDGEVRAVMPVQMRRTGDEDPQMGRWADFLLQSYVGPRIGKLSLELLKEAKSRPVSEIQRADTMEFEAPHPIEANRRRLD